MTLFWHIHFAASNRKVQSLNLMLEQNDTLRRHALGEFAGLMNAVATDPAMLIWLDGESSRAIGPTKTSPASFWSCLRSVRETTARPMSARRHGLHRVVPIPGEFLPFGTRRVFALRRRNMMTATRHFSAKRDDGTPTTLCGSRWSNRRRPSSCAASFIERLFARRSRPRN